MSNKVNKGREGSLGLAAVFRSGDPWMAEHLTALNHLISSERFTKGRFTHLSAFEFHVQRLNCQNIRWFEVVGDNSLNNWLTNSNEIRSCFRKCENRFIQLIHARVLFYTHSYFCTLYKPISNRYISNSIVVLLSIWRYTKCVVLHPSLHFFMREFYDLFLMFF